MSNITPTIHSLDTQDEDAFFNNLREVSGKDSYTEVKEYQEPSIVEDLKEYDGNDEFFTYLKKQQEAIEKQKVSVNTNPGSFNLDELKAQNPVKPDTAKSLVDEALQKSKSTQPQYSEEVYDVAFQFIKENNLLNIPEGIELSPETLPKILEYDHQKRVNAAFDYIRNQAGDYYVAELFDMVINGGTLQELETGKDIVSEESYLRSLDVRDEDTQRKLLATYMKQGLDANIPSQAEMISEIPSRIDAIIGSYKGEERAMKALDYFLKDIQQAKVDLEQSKRQRIQEEEAIKVAKHKREEFWRNSFIDTLKDRNWSNAKKNEVWSHFNTIKLTDGTSLPLWDYKMKKIWENPKHTQALFRFLSEFDEYTNDFKTVEKTSAQLATDKIMEMAARKSVSKNTTNHTYSKDTGFTRENLGEYIDQKGVSPVK